MERTIFIIFIYAMTVLGQPSRSQLSNFPFDGGSPDQNAKVFQVMEEAPNGTDIHGVAEYLQQATSFGSDPYNKPPDVQVSFQLLGAPDALTNALRLEPHSGKLTVIGRIDRETLCSKYSNEEPSSSMSSSLAYQQHQYTNYMSSPNKACLKKLEVIATASTGSRQSEMKKVTLWLRIEDINDNSPQWPQQGRSVGRMDPIPVIELQVLESPRNPHAHLPQPAKLQLPAAHDPDAGLNGQLTYRISPVVPGDNQYAQSLDASIEPSPFILEEEPSGTLHLVSTTNLDFEKQSSYEMYLIAADSGNPPRTSTALVRVHLIDVNDESPIFEHEVFYPPNGAISEKTVPGTLIMNLSATDADASSENNRLRFMMLPNPTAAKFFIVHPDGRISLRQWLDYESMSSATPTTIPSSNTQHSVDSGQVRKQFVFKVQAIDSAPAPYERKGEAMVVVPIIDENDEAPVISPRFLGPPELTNHGVMGVVTENAVTPVRLAYIQVRDPDFNGKDKVSCHLTDNANFSLVPTRSTNLADLAYSAVERDDSNNDFVLSLLTQPDRERTPLLQVRIKCADPVGNANEQTLRIRVLDVNDETPTFTKSVYRFRLPENTDTDTTLPLRAPNGSLIPGGHRVGKVIAHDNDLDDHARIVYRLAPDRLDIEPAITAKNYSSLYATHAAMRNTFLYNPERKPPVEELFRIDEQTGVLYTLKSFDAENVAALRLNVLAVDQPKDSELGSLTGTAEVEIRITDVNDWPPVFYRINATSEEEENKATPGTSSAPMEYVSSYVFHVKENKPAYWLVGRVAAIDPDIGQHTMSDVQTAMNTVHSQVSLKFAGDSDPDVRKTFSLHSTSGYLRTRVSLDREKKVVYVFNVIASDSGNNAGSERSSTATVTVFVEDENDNDPVFIRPVGAVSKTISPGEAKLEPNFGNPVDPPSAWDSAQPNDASESRLGTAPHLNSNQLPGSRDTDIPIVVVHRNTWSQRDGTSANGGRPLLELEAKDADFGENGRITYRIGAGNSAGLFMLDNATGTLMISSKMANEQENEPHEAKTDSSLIKAEPSELEYRLLFEACDNGVPKRCATPIWVRILLDMNEVPKMISGNQLAGHMMNEYYYPEPPKLTGHEDRGLYNADGARMAHLSGVSPGSKQSGNWEVSSGDRGDAYHRSAMLPRDHRSDQDKYNWHVNGLMPNRRLYVDSDGRSFREFNHAPTSTVVSEAVIICLVVVFIVLLCAASILFYLVRRKSIKYTVGSRIKSANRQTSVPKGSDGNLASFHSQAGVERLETDEGSSVYRVTKPIHPDGGKASTMTATESSNLTGTQGTATDIMSLHALLRRNSEPLLDQVSNNSRLASLNESMYMSRALLPPNSNNPSLQNNNFCPNLVRKGLQVPQSPLIKPVPRSITPFWELSSGVDQQGTQQLGLTDSSIWKPANQKPPNAVYQVGPHLFANRNPMHSAMEDQSYNGRNLVTTASYLGISPPPRQGGLHLRGDSLPVYAEQISPRMTTSGKWPSFHPIMEHHQQPYQELTNLTATLRRHNYPMRSNTWFPQDKVFSNTLRAGSSVYGPVHSPQYVLTPRFHYANRLEGTQTQVNGVDRRPTSPCTAQYPTSESFCQSPSVLSRCNQVQNHGCDKRMVMEDEDVEFSSREFESQSPDKPHNAPVLLTGFSGCNQSSEIADQSHSTDEGHDLDNPTFVESSHSSSHKTMNSPSYSRAKYVYEAYREASFV